jgi:hypothetical protein
MVSVIFHGGSEIFLKRQRSLFEDYVTREDVSLKHDIDISYSSVL